MEPLEDAEYEIVGYADFLTDMQEKNGLTPPDILVPFGAVRESHHRQGIRFVAHSACFTVGISWLWRLLWGDTLNVNDSVFISTASRLRQLIGTALAFYPVLLVLIVCAGYLVALLLLQSRRKEMALLRSIGIGRARCFFLFFREQFLLTLSGVLAGSLIAVLLHGNYGGNSAFTGCMVGICYLLGNSFALWRLLKVGEMEAWRFYGRKKSVTVTGQNIRRWMRCGM